MPGFFVHYGRFFFCSMTSRLPASRTDRRYILLGMKIAGDFGITIAVPVVIFVLAGQWADAQLGVRPWATIGAFVLAAALSGLAIYRKAKRYGKEYAALGTKDQSSTD